MFCYYKTYDYDRFKFFKFNRTAGTNKNIRRSIEDIDMTPYVPILVTEDYHIIDGQNRFLCCKEKGLPIYYIFYRGDAERAMVALNTATSVWRQEEWLQYYCGKGDETYIRLRRSMERYGLNISNAILLFSNRKTNAADFKAGKLRDDSAYLAAVAEFLEEIKAYVPRDVISYRPFVNALLIFMTEHGERDRARLRSKISAVTKFSRTEDYTRSFENWVRR